MERKLKILNNGKSYNCYSGCICYILQSRGTFLSEAVSFGLSGGLGFVFTLGKNMSFSCVREKHCLTEYLLNLGLHVEENPITNYAWIKKHIQTCIDRNEPVMLRYDGYYLPYTPIYKKEHDVRIGLVTGYGENYYYMTDFVYEIINYKVSEDHMKAAIFSNECDRETFEVFFVTTPTNLETKLTKQSVTESILECVDFFLDSVSTSELLLGLDGIKKIANHTQEYIDVMIAQDNWETFIVDLKQAAIAIKNYAFFFKEVRKVGLTDIDNKIIEKVFLAFKRSSEEWNYFCNCITIYKITKKTEYMQKMMSVLYDFNESMSEVFTLLKRNIS